MLVFLEVVFSLIIVACLIGVIASAWRASQRRGQAPVAVPALAPPAAGGLILALLGVLSAIGLQWADRRRRQLERKE